MPNKTPKSQRVLAAVRAGATTSLEVSAVTDLPVNFCSAYLGRLVKRRVLRRTVYRIFPQCRRVTEYALIHKRPTVAGQSRANT